MKIYSASEWLLLSQNHDEALKPFVGEHLERQRLGKKHPIWDFLFTYYSFGAKQLLDWQPGFGVVLQGEAAKCFLSHPMFVENRHGISLDIQKFPKHRLDSVEWVARLLKNVAERPGRYGCFGLHEWAMVYKAPSVRHSNLPLRLSPKELESFVESQNLCCTHYDAFRFFTPEAAPLNCSQPLKGRQPEQDQVGCVHANMDLYKWSYKFHPWISSEIVRKAFFLAMEARLLDMRASPYDVSVMGFEPICIETLEGKAKYVELQRQVAEKSIPIRQALIEVLEKLYSGSTVGEGCTNRLAIS